MRVLFVCTGNTCRSPMAERIARLLYPQAQFESAGVMPANGMQVATAVTLRGLGADTEGFASRSVFDLDLATFTDVVLIGPTACQHAPPMPAGVRVHRWDVADPFEFSGSAEEQLAVYQACAAELTERIRQLMAGVSTSET